MVRYEVVRVSPEVASTWLANPSRRQRVTTRNVVVGYARAMVEGRWQEPTIDPIAITPEGKLLNGSHRLLAIIRSGLTIDMLVAYDVPEELFPYIDGGRRRQAAQFIRTPSATAVAAACRVILWYDHRRLADPKNPSRPEGFNMAFDTDEVLAVAEGPLSQVIAQSVNDASRAQRAAGIPAGVHAAVLTLARREGTPSDKIDEWLEGVVEGIGLVVGDPRLLLRNRMLDQIRGKHLRRSSAAVWMLLARAFNAFMQGRTMKALVYEASDPPPALDPLGSAVPRQPSTRRHYVEQGLDAPAGRVAAKGAG